MNGAFYIGATGLRSQERALDATANNIANINTPGYKRTEVRFSELVGPTAPDQLVEPGAAVLGGVNAIDAARVFVQGEMKPTGQPLDLAIDGDGFIEVLGPAGQILLWRGGSLRVNAEGYLAAGDGLPLKAMISVPAGASALTISRDGVVRATVDGSTEPVELGRIELAVARDPAQLALLSEGFYQARAETDLIGVRAGEDGGGVFVQGALEGSNVSMSDEMVTLMLMQRAYAANAQIVQAGDQLMSIANGLKR